MTLIKQHTNGSNWQLLFDDLPTGVVIIDGQGIVEACNKAAKDFLGEEVLQRLWVDVIQSCFSPKEDDGHEISLIDGRRVNVSIKSLKDRAGEMIVLNDLTVTREFEHERGRQVRLQEMGEMLAHLAHQIRTPLASAMLYSNNLDHPHLTAEKHSSYINKIKFCHQNIEQQVRDLLVFAKGGESLLQTVNMHNFMKAIVNKTDVKLAQAGGELIIENLVQGLNFICQSEALEGAISNLIDNALNAHATKIFLNVEKQAEQLLVFNVIDDGDGMDENTVKQSTRPFYTTRAKGTGLGLAVVDAVVKSHHGKLKVISKQGIGSTFSIRLPLVTSTLLEEMQ